MINTTSLLLDANSWDITVNEKGNIATVTQPYAIAQNVGCAVSTFLGESVANPAIGVDYESFQDGKGYNYLSFLFKREAERLEYVSSATAFLYFTKDERRQRQLTGLITIIDTDKNQSTLTL